MKFIVCMCASAPNKLMPIYLEQLGREGIPFHVEQLALTSPNDGTMGRCLSIYRDFAQRFDSYDRLIITDAWDVLCYGSQEEIAETLKELSCRVVYAGERNCYPETPLRERIPERGPWSFVNGGMLTATPMSLFGWCDLVAEHPHYDPSMIGQQWLNRRLAEDSLLIEIDALTKLFYCYFMEHCGPALQNLKGRPYNSLYSTFPKFIHFNGSCDWNPFLEMMR